MEPDRRDLKTRTLPVPIYPYEQSLVYAQVHINRAVFEMNRPGYPKNDSAYKTKPDREYILKQIIEAQEELRTVIKTLKRKPEAA